MLFSTAALGEDPAGAALQSVPGAQVVIQDEFWSPKFKVWREVTIPDCFAKFDKDGALTNFDKIRDGAVAEHGGPPWYDGLTYEMIRGCADFLTAQRDPALEAQLDGYIDRIAAAAAKDPDGYLNTYTQLKEPTHRWGLNGGNDNWQHDVYNAGCMIEAGVHYYRATGKARLLQVATRLANHMCDVIGPPPRKNVIPGHSLAEEALVRLYELYHEQPQIKEQFPFSIDEERYLALAEFFIEARGHWEGRTSFGAYGQDDRPVFEQTEIEGHAVRATLMCAGVAALARVRQRTEYCQAAQRLWENMATRKTYITGGSGATAEGEAFAQDYVLPNTGYLETCRRRGQRLLQPKHESGFRRSTLYRRTGTGTLQRRPGRHLPRGKCLLLRQSVGVRAGRASAMGLARMSLLSPDVPQDHGRIFRPISMLKTNVP